jgi:glycosyltransferase involved in cell wall biosynthesis
LEDNFGVVLAEAAGAGLPLISTPYAGATDHFIVPGKNGYILESADHAGLCNALDQILSHPRPEELRNASASIAERNDVVASAQQFAEAIEIALQRGRQPVAQSIST